MKPFIMWMLRKISHSITSFPRRHFLWYKSGIEYELGFVVFYTLGRYVFTGMIVMLISIGVLIVFGSSSDLVTFGTIAILYSYYTVELIAVIISIQYDKYCAELQRTMDLLAAKDAYKEEDSMALIRQRTAALSAHYANATAVHNAQSQAASHATNQHQKY